jgi:hypothetical protein
MSERKVRDVLATLEERGWIGREEQRRSDGSRTTDLVTVIGLEASNRHHVPGVGQDVPVLPAPRAAQEGIPYEGVPSEGLTSSSVVPFMGAAHPASKSAEEGLTLREIADSLQPGSKAAGTWRYLRNLRDENSARAKSILLASKDLWCGVVTLPGRVEDNVRVMAEKLDEFGLERVMAAWDRSNGKTSRLNYFCSVVADPNAGRAPAAVTVLPPVDIEDRKREILAANAARQAELEKEFVPAVGSN